MSQSADAFQFVDIRRKLMKASYKIAARQPIGQLSDASRHLSGVLNCLGL